MQEWEAVKNHAFKSSHGKVTPLKMDHAHVSNTHFCVLCVVWAFR